MRFRSLAIAAVLTASVPVLTATEPVDQGAIARIKIEGFQHSEVMETLSWLSDVYGPRLSGSPNLQKAGEWARDRMASWGMAKGALEPYDTTYRPWATDGFELAMVQPTYMRIYGYPMAWSPGTPAPVVGTPVLVEVKTKEDFAKYRGQLRGAIVMNGKPEVSPMGFEPEAKRLTDDDLAKQRGAINPGEPASLKEEEDDFTKGVGEMLDKLKFFADEGVAAVITPSASPEAVRVTGYFDQKWHVPYPSFVFSREHYGRIMRLLDKKQPVTLSLKLSATLGPEVKGFNVVAEIPGTDARLKNQVVMLGGHLDSWHTGTGATDNGAGCAVAMEAVRILQAAGLKPRRTIRVALWTGEEQDYYGSTAYVKQHFGDPAGTARQPEHALLAAYFNLDNGSGRIRGVNLQGNEAARPIFEGWLEPFRYLDAATVTTLNTGGTDHMLFNAVGLPGFQFIQDPLNYETRTHHSSLDVYEEAVPDDLKQASVIMASLVYHAAMRDEMLPRPELPRAATDKKH